MEEDNPEGDPKELASKDSTRRVETSDTEGTKEDSDVSSRPEDEVSEEIQKQEDYFSKTSKSKALKANKVLKEIYSGCNKPEYNKFQNQFTIWELTLDSSKEEEWKDIMMQIATLTSMFSSEDLSEEKKYSDVTNTSGKQEAVRRWADYSSSEPDDITDDLEELIGWDDLSTTASGIVIPDDLETLWPKGYEVITNVAKDLGFTVTKTHKNLQSGGFRPNDLFCLPKEEAKVKYASFDREMQSSINAFRALIMFLKIQPNQVLAQDAKFAVSASYVLHFLLKTGDEERDARNNKCLKHQDGGRSILNTRLGRLFSVNPSIGSSLLLNLDKLYRAHARRLIERHEISVELRELMIQFCFTSPEGMLTKFYAKERRREKRTVEKVNAKGKVTLTSEIKLVDGQRIPTLQLGSDFLTSDEKEELRKYDRQFNLTAIVKERSAKADDPSFFENLAKFVEDLVSDAYAATKGLGAVIRQRKRRHRGHIVPVDGKVSPSAWQTALNEAMEEVTPIPQRTFEEIRDFIQKYKV
jgi:hypothetical protein